MIRASVRPFRLMMFAALLVMLTLASSASAGCTWIAWSWSVGMGEQYGIDTPNRRIAAFQTQAECLEFARKRARWIPMAKEKGSKVTDTTVGADVERANGTMVSFDCWPDSVDPREPKASAR